MSERRRASCTQLCTRQTCERVKIAALMAPLIRVLLFSWLQLVSASAATPADDTAATLADDTAATLHALTAGHVNNASETEIYASGSEYVAKDESKADEDEPFEELRHELDAELSQVPERSDLKNEKVFEGQFHPDLDVNDSSVYSSQVVRSEDEVMVSPRDYSRPRGNEGRPPDRDGGVVFGNWGSNCDCWNTTDDVEVECRCGGTEIPQTLASNVNRITVVDSNMTDFKEGWLQVYRHSLREIVLTSVNYLKRVEPSSFKDLNYLRTIYISYAPNLHSLPEDLFSALLPSLKIIRIMDTGLEHVPRLQIPLLSLHMVDLENNLIRRVNSQAVRVKTQQFLLNYNQIEVIEKNAFEGAQISKLSLKGNRKLTTIDAEAFNGLRSLRDLDLSETAILFLPTHGLNELEVLRLEDTFSLKTFPSIYNFEYLEKAWLTYPFHCCAFQFPATHDPEQFAKHERYVALIHTKFCSDVASSRRRREDYGRVVLSPDNLTLPTHHTPDWGALEREYARGGGSNVPAWNDDGVFHQSTVAISPRLIQVYCGKMSSAPRNFTCTPKPDAFNPCEDIMGNWGLRVAVWLVAISAVVGNLAVLLVLLSSKFRMTVPKFLMCNLALADLCMGLYLLLIAAVDASSIGAYFNHAIDWQRGIGCQVAGFLTVFASELSIFTLTVITSERWYAITYALHLDKRLRLATASKIMVCGWLYSIVMAALPILGISDYSMTSICLPLESRRIADLIYLMTLLLVNGLAFALICTCYGRIYCAISGNDSVASRSDKTVAKRMALLVFTDFACWAPIAFFGLTALAGFPLIDVTHLKILLVFFYPLNSCANPYLYALLTKQYRRDLFTLLSRHGLCTKKAARYKGADVGYSSGNSLPQNGRNSSLAVGHCVSLDTPKTDRTMVNVRSGSADGITQSVISKEQRGSPHPLRNSNTRLNLTPDQEMILRRILDLQKGGDSSTLYTPPVDSHF